MTDLQATALSDDAVILDVREDDEWAAGHAPGAIHIPLGDLPTRLADLPDVDPLPVVCRSGGRSSQAVAWLEHNGIDAVNVDGGMRAWSAANKPMVAAESSQPPVVL